MNRNYGCTIILTIQSTRLLCGVRPRDDVATYDDVEPDQTTSSTVGVRAIWRSATSSPQSPQDDNLATWTQQAYHLQPRSPSRNLKINSPPFGNITHCPRDNRAVGELIALTGGFPRRQSRKPAPRNHHCLNPVINHLIRYVILGIYTKIMGHLGI